MRSHPTLLATRISTVLVSTLFAVGVIGTTQLGCSSSGNGNEGSGGATGSGGTTSSSGGKTGSGGTSSGGSTGSGGKTGSGGTTGSGGSASGGSTGSGGTTASGGSIGSGGSTGSGGSASGGATAEGGATASGGHSGTGGMAGHAPGGQPGQGGRAAGGQGGRTGGAGGMGGGAPNDTGGAAMLPLNMTLTSTQVTEGSPFPTGITCADSSMGSPDLTWTAGPSGTMSYAVTLTDLTFNGLVHWAIWNIPATTTNLPAKLATTATLTTPAGAQQVAIQGNGYYGPCPMGTTHTYQFRVYAIGAAALPGSTPTTAANAKAAIVQNAIGTGTLTGSSNASKM